MTNDQIKEYIAKKYPHIQINNTIFLEEIAFQELEEDMIVNILMQLDSEDAIIIYVNLFHYGRENSSKEIIKYFIKENLNYLKEYNKKRIRVYYENEDLIKEYTRLYQEKEFTLADLKKVQEQNIANNKDKNNDFYNFDINYYNQLIITQKLYKEKKIKYDDILPFIQLTVELLKYRLIRAEGNYEERYNNYINEIISHLLIGNIQPEQFGKCLNEYQTIKKLMYITKFGTDISDFDNVSIDLIAILKGKQILNSYEEFLKIPNLEKVKENFDQQKILKIIINMSILLGYDNVNNIIRHMPQDYQKIERLFDSFYRIDLTNIKMEDNKIVYNNEFIKLFIGNNLEEPNNLLNLIYEGKTSLDDKIETLYAYWDILEERFKMQPLKTKLAFLEEVLKVNKVILKPDEYRLEGKIINSYYDNKQFQHYTNVKLVNQVKEEYQKMKHNYQKTIPYVNGIYDEYSYETLKADDPNLFIMGALTNCCFKIGGQADSFVRYCAHDPNGRVLAVKNKQGQFVAMAPMVRNGNLILCNSVESPKVNNKAFMEKMFAIIEQAGNKMIEISSQTESKEQSIHALLTGSYKNEISDFNKYKKVKYGEISPKCSFPLNTEIYANMGGYEWENYIISSIPNLRYYNLKSFYPTTLYDDPRRQELEIEKEYITEDIKKVANSICYEATKSILDFDNLEKIILNKDWLITIDKKYKIASYIVGKDERAKEEYMEYLELAKEHCSYYDEDGNLKENNVIR